MIHLIRFLAYPLVRLFLRPTIEGRSRMPRTGRVIVASNHLSFIDSIVISILSRRRVRFLAKSDYFTTPGVKGFFMRTFFTAVGAIGVERAAGAAATAALDRGLEVLANDDVFAIYPEGTRSRDGRLYKGRTGVSHLALQAGAPIVPVGLIGTDRMMPAETNRFHPVRITVRFGEPIDVAPYLGMKQARARRELTDEVMRRIAALSEQPLAGVYNEPPAQGVIERVQRAFRTGEPKDDGSGLFD